MFKENTVERSWKKETDPHVTCSRSVVFTGYSVSSTYKTDRLDVTEILLKVALNATTLTLNSGFDFVKYHYLVIIFLILNMTTIPYNLE